tara:strand:+ start:188 stop:604 length:417 start_codon:yes stop_codon:yes gene_type:complete
MAVITKRKNNLKSKSSMKTKRSSKSKSNSKTRKQFKKFRKNGMGTRKMMGGEKGAKQKPNHLKVHSISRQQGKKREITGQKGIKWTKPSIFSKIKAKITRNRYKSSEEVMKIIQGQQESAKSETTIDQAKNLGYNTPG